MLQIYNTLTRKKEIFSPIKDKRVKMYVCGPTVYGPSHLGHARTYIIFDFIKRFLEFSGYKTKYVMNITDVHDDIYKKSEELKIPSQKLAQKYTDEFLADLKALKIQKAFKYPRVSEHIKEIIKIIKILIKKEVAYETEDGVYFRISSLTNYGALSGRKIGKAITGTRVKTDKYEKEEVADFALWKKTQGEWVWDSPWDKGRPGWHIECSAMSKKYMGMPFDIHGGAMDLIFPHHENEIAQSESAFNKKYVNYFLHSGLLYVNGQKMSKSLGNFVVINDFIKKYPPRFIRFFVLSHHWRATLDLNEKTINDAWNNFLKINEFIEKAKIQKLKVKSASQKSKVNDVELFKQEFLKFLEDDFNGTGAINYLLEFINKAQTHANWTQTDADMILKILKQFDKFFVCFFTWTKISAETNNLIKQREKLREEKNYNEADKVRKILQEQGIILEDLKDKTLTINLN